MALRVATAVAIGMHGKHSLPMKICNMLHEADRDSPGKEHWRLDQDLFGRARIPSNGGMFTCKADKAELVSIQGLLFAFALYQPDLIILNTWRENLYKWSLVMKVIVEQCSSYHSKSGY